MDSEWQSHIDEMNALRERVALQAYAQKNPLHEYQSLGYEMFTAFLAKTDSTLLRLLLRSQVAAPSAPATANSAAAPRRHATEYQQRGYFQRPPKPGRRCWRPATKPHWRAHPHPRRRATADTGPKIERNAPCPCGSGKKFKRCCG